MKIMKIKDRTGYFINPKKINVVNGTDDSYNLIENISKNDVFDIVDFILDNEVEIDDYIEGSLPNPVQATVYKSLAENINKLLSSKMMIIKDVDEHFRDAEKKYIVK